MNDVGCYFFAKSEKLLAIQAIYLLQKKGYQVVGLWVNFLVVTTSIVGSSREKHTTYLFGCFL